MKQQKLDLARREIVGHLERLLEKIQPRFVFYPDGNDSHQDHRKVTEASEIALRIYNVNDYVDMVYTYETGSTKGFVPNSWFDITEEIERKIEAMMCYESETRKGYHPRSVHGIKALAGYRGSQICCKYAEGFKLLRGKHIWQ